MEQLIIYRILILIFGSLSLVATMITIVRFHKTRSQFRNFHSKLVAFLCYSDFTYVLTQFYYLIVNWVFAVAWEENTFCFGTAFQGFVQSVSVLNSFALISIISYSLYRVIISHDSIDERVQNPVLHYSFLTIILPCLLSLVPIFTEN